MKTVTYSKIGYNHPSNANWSYGIFKVDTIDTEEACCMSYTVYEKFGGDSRFRDKIKAITGIKPIETTAVYPLQKVTGIRSMDDMESEEFISTIAGFLQN